jgi:hypothetical protein
MAVAAAEAPSMVTEPIGSMIRRGSREGSLASAVARTDAELLEAFAAGRDAAAFAELV